MGNIVKIVVDIPYLLEVELPEGKTIDDVHGLSFGNQWELSYRDNEQFSSIFVNLNDFTRFGKFIDGTKIYDYETKRFYTNKELGENHGSFQ